MSVSVKNNRKFYAIMIISFLIMVFFGKLPPFGAMTEYGMKFLGIFLGCIFAWLFDVIIPVCLMGIIMSGMLVEGKTVDGMMTALQSANTVLLVFWAFFFVYALQQSGMLDYLSNKIMSLKVCSKSPWHLAIAIYICAMVVAAISGQGFASAVIMFAMYYSLAEKVGAQKRSRYTTFVLASMAGVVHISTGIMPYAGLIYTCLTFMQAVVPDAVFNIPAICLTNLVVTICTIIILAVLLKVLMVTKVIVPEFTMDSNNVLVDKGTKMNAKIKWGFFYIVLLFVLMMLPILLADDNPINVFLKPLGTMGIFVLIDALMCLTTVDGEKLLDIEKAIKKGAVSWQVYFMMGSALVISGQLVTPEAGLAVTIEQALGGVVGNLSIYALCFIFFFIGMALTNCITNTVAMQLIIPVMSIFMVAKGYDPVVMVGLSGLVLVYGQILPSGSPLGAFVHGNTEWLDVKGGYIFVTITVACFMIAISAVGIPLALFLG